MRVCQNGPLDINLCNFYLAMCSSAYGEAIPVHPIAIHNTN